MEDINIYCKDAYDFYNKLQRYFHKWRHGARIENHKLILPKVKAPINALSRKLEKLIERRQRMTIPTTDDFFIKNVPTQLSAIFKAAEIQIGILSGKSFDPLFLRNELYEIDIEKWFIKAQKEIHSSFTQISKTLGHEKVVRLISESGEGSIVGKKKIASHVNTFTRRALSRIDDFTCLTVKQKEALKKKTEYKIDFNIAPGHVMRITPGEKTMYFNSKHPFSSTFLDFILSHDYCGHAFHDTLTNKIFSKERPMIYKTWYDDECDMFSCFGEGMSCYVEKVAPSFLGLNQDVIDYLHVRQKIWLPLRVVLDMKINVKDTPMDEVIKYMSQYDFPEKFSKYVIESIIFHSLGYMSVYYPSLMKMEDLQRRHHLSPFDFYQKLLTAGNVTIDLFENYLDLTIGKAQVQ